MGTLPSLSSRVMNRLFKKKGTLLIIEEILASMLSTLGDVME